MGNEAEFARRFRKEHGVHARYATGSLRLGEVGRMQDGVFVPTDFYPWVSDFGEAPPEKEGASFTLALGSVRETALQANAEVPELSNLVVANAGALFTFGQEFSALVIVKGARVRRVQSVEGLWRELIRRQRLPKNDPEHFDPDLRIVTAVTQVDAFWIYAGRQAGTKVALDATAEATSFDLASLRANFSVREAKTARAQAHGTNSTPLFRLAGITRPLPGFAYRGGFLDASPTASSASASSAQPTPTESGSLEELQAAASAPRFDHLYVVSDLHVGGKEVNMKPYDESVAMEWLGDHLAAKAQQERVCWVIAGDIIDFLAYHDEKEPRTYFDCAAALDKLEQIAEDNEGTFRAWGRFAAAGASATLVFLLGNHDLELGTTTVWTKFCELIREKSGLPANTKFRLPDQAIAGKDYRCIVGGQHVCVKHGNEADEWNLVDYAKLGRISDKTESGTGWKPNLGTELVIDHMNAVKKSHPFVDLLKPENGAVATILLPLLPMGLSKLVEGAGLAAVEQYVKSRKTWTGRVGDDEVAGQLGDRGVAPDVSGDELVSGALRLLERGGEPLDLVQQPGALGPLRFLWERLKRTDPDDAAYEAVLEHMNDRSFDLRAADEWYEWFGQDQHYPIHTNVLIVGHTHLAKLIHRTTNTVYVNSGTWMPLINLPSILAQGRNRFKELFSKLHGSIDSLGDLVIRRRTVAHVSSDGVQLCSVQPARGAIEGRVQRADDLELKSVAALQFAGGQ